MLMLNKIDIKKTFKIIFYILFLSLRLNGTYLLNTEDAPSILLSGTLEYMNARGTKEIISLEKKINADTFKQWIEQLLLDEKWQIKDLEHNKLKIFSEEHFTRAYDFGSSDSGARLDFTVASTKSSSTDARAVEFHPNGKYLLTGGDGAFGANSQIFAISETGSALYVLQNCSQFPGITPGGAARSLQWHPSGNYYALVGTNSQNLLNNTGTVTFNTSIRIYQFDETNKKSTLLTYAQASPDVDLSEIHWHPSGKYLAVIGSTNPTTFVQVYSFLNNTLTELPLSKKNGPIGSLEWHPSGNYLTVVGNSSGTIQTFYFNNETLTYLPTLDIANNPDFAWDPTGNYLAVMKTGTVSVYKCINFTSFQLKATYIRGAGGSYTLKWSPDGSYLLLTGAVVSAATLYILQWQEETLTEIPACRYNHGASTFYGNWSPDGSFIAISGTTVSGVDIRLLQFTENTTELTRKNRGMLHRINNLIKQSYQDVLETHTLIQATSSAMINANPLYLSPTSTLNPGIQFTGVAWENMNSGASTLNPIYHDWHPSGKYIAISEGSDSSGDNFLHIFSQESTSTFKPLHSTYFPTRAGADYRPQALSWSPNGDFLSVQLGPSNLPQTETKLYSFDGSNLVLTLTSVFFSRQAPSWHPNSSFLLTTTPSNIFTLLKFNNTYTSTFQSGFPIPGTSTIGRGQWTPDGKSFFAWNSGTGAVGGYFYDFTSETGSCVQLFSTAIPSTNINAISMRPETDITDESAYLAIGFNGDTPNLRIYQFNGISQVTPSVTILPGCSLNEQSSVKNLAWSNDGQHLAVVWGGTPQYMQVYRFVDKTWLSPTGLIVQNTDTGTGSLSWDPLSLFIAQAPSAPTIAPFIIRPEQYFHQDLLISSSNLINNINFLGIDGPLTIANSNAIVTYKNLAIATSQGWVTDYTLMIQNSDAVNAHLIGMSNAIAQLNVQTSYGIISIESLNKATSSAILSISPLNIQNSNAIVSDQTTIIGSSNAISGLLVATSNAVAGLLVATSNAAAGLLVATSYAAQSLSTKLTPLNTIDIGPANIHFNSPTITMSYNLLLSTDHQLFVHASGVVNGNGHSITFARGAGTQMTIDPAITTTFQNVIFKDYNDASVVIGAGSSFIFGDDCRVELAEPQTLSRTWSFAGQSLLDGQNKSITLGTGNNFLSSLRSASLTIANANLLNVRDNNIRAANNNAAIIFNNAQIYLSSNFTYSIGSMAINNDVTLRGTSIFNYSTIMGLTIASQSQLTIDQGCTFNYAPAGNFRNLLSFTNSSATLFFNNASLVATATGPRLINGTLLIDGVMNIQSSAVSTAQAIIFGNGTPANDLIIKLMPSATINLLSGFLNYANAQ
jgi:uncharacterized protein with WD repeat